MNYNNQSNIKSNHIKSDGDRIRCDQKEQTINAYAELVKKNIDFDVLLHTYSREQDLVEEIYQLILETVQTEKDMIRIAGEYYPAGFVKGKLLKLNYSHIEYVLECMDKNTTKVRNIKQYLLAALFNILRCGSTYGVCNFGKLVDVHTNLVHFLIHCFQISGICIDNHAINRHLTEIDTHIRGLG